MFPFATRVETHAIIGSTMDRARELAEAGAPEGTLVLADAQTAGRGTGGRRWLSPPGTQLALTLIVRPALEGAHLPRLTMWIGLALLTAVRARLARPDLAQLKWPNDLLIDGRKAAGILVEGAFGQGRLRYALIGVGLNLAAAPPDDAVEYPATHLAAHATTPGTRDDVLRDFLSALALDYPAVLFDAELASRWRAALWWPLEPVSLDLGAERIVGRLSGVTAAGALIVETDQGARTLETGRLRPMAAGPYNADEGGPSDV